MSNKRYFQIKNFEYTYDAFKIGRTGVIAYIFSVIPDSNEKSAFVIKVIFPGQIVKQLGAAISGSHLLIESAKPVFLRHAFKLLKEELEVGDFSHVQDITISSDDISQLKKPLLKQCDFLEIEDMKQICTAEKRHVLLTTTETCHSCIIPEPLFRCANLRIKSNWGEKDDEGKWQITPECVCTAGNTLPGDLTDCRGLPCYTPFKFYLPEEE